MRLAISGAAGRMGVALVQTIAETPSVQLALCIESKEHPWIGRDSGEAAGIAPNGIPFCATPEAKDLEQIDGIIDFSTPPSSCRLVLEAIRHNLVYVVGVTGFSAAQEKIMMEAAKEIPLVKSGNMSPAIALLSAFVQQAAQSLDESFDIEILETHHRDKRDAPSGTALLLGESAAKGRGILLTEKSVRVRDGHMGARKPGDIGFASLRGGSVIGEHHVMFIGRHETITLSHVANDRNLFARGAIRAALWAKGKNPGLYSMTHVLGVDASFRKEMKI